METIHATVLTDGLLLADRDVVVDQDRIISVGPATKPVRGLLTPGFIDQHCHGGGGFDLGTAATEAAAFHVRHGVTSLIASLVTADPGTLAAQVADLAPLVDDGTIAGIHLEGPWLSPQQCGAHEMTQLRDPDPVEVDHLLASGYISMITFAPELPGALAAIEQTVRAGAVAAIGHTDCDYNTAVLAIEAGATVATHLFNRMPHLGKRHPGPVLALLEDPRVILELIPDAVHVDPHLLRYVFSVAGADRVCAVTDAMAAAGMGDGDYRLGALDVEVRGGVARLARDRALAGSTLTLDEALRRLVAAGVPLPAAVQSMTATPARAMGLLDRGSIAVGQRADLVLLDDDLSVARVMRSGSWVV